MFSENRGLVYNQNRPNKKNHKQTDFVDQVYWISIILIVTTTYVEGLHQTLFHTFKQTHSSSVDEQIISSHVLAITSKPKHTNSILKDR